MLPYMVITQVGPLWSRQLLKEENLPRQSSQRKKYDQRKGQRVASLKMGEGAHKPRNVGASRG